MGRHLIDRNNNKESEKFSSSFTLSDMEIFIFPELFYPLVLSNIISPILWKWRSDPWFTGIEKKGFNYKVNRIKQYIIQNYSFNLDLNTWGLTEKGRETSRFSDFFDPEVLKSSNALFGYEGDKYYFSIDIRRHFGLDKYNDEVIPYWKTETIEAMDAFRYKDGYPGGAGECVSLSALYAAAMFVVGRIPLENIFLVATPLHSQNFIVEKEGLLTNNRRIVTKNMWFNGTSLSAKARRALENERVTIVSHISGHIHTLFEDAYISTDAYDLFCEKIRDFITTKIDPVIFINFLRFKPQYRVLFQFKYEFGGRSRFIPFEKMIEYEHFSKFNVTSESRSSLMREIDSEEFFVDSINGRLLLNDLEEFLQTSTPHSASEIFRSFFSGKEGVDANLIGEMISDLDLFCVTNPMLPATNKKFHSYTYPSIDLSMDREEIEGEIISSSAKSEMSLLTLYVNRRIDLVDPYPFLKAAIERSPVSFELFGDLAPAILYRKLLSLTDASIYGEKRLAQPDEVANFQRGDGLEKAVVMVSVLAAGGKSSRIELTVSKGKVTVKTGDEIFFFNSDKRHRV